MEGRPIAEDLELILATNRGNMLEVEALLEKGANVNAVYENGMTSLILACYNGNSDIAKILIENGADVNAVDGNGQMALMLACYDGKVDIVKFLIEKGAYVNAKDKIGNAALLFTCMNGNLDIVKMDIIKLLIANKADVNSQNKSGHTLLMVACWHGKLEMAKILIENGADVDAPNISSYLMPFKIPQLKKIIKSLLESEHVKNAIEDVLRQTELSEAQKNQLLKQNCKTKEDCIKFIKNLSEIIKLYGKYGEIIHSSVHKTLDITLRINKFLGINTNFITKEELTEYNAMSTETQTQYRGAMYKKIGTNLKNTFAVLLAKNQVKNNLKTISKRIEKRTK